MMLPAPFTGELLGSSSGNHLVENGLLFTKFAQEPAKALHMLPHAAGAGEDDAHAGSRDIDTFVEHLARHDDRVLAAMEAFRTLDSDWAWNARLHGFAELSTSVK